MNVIKRIRLEVAIVLLTVYQAVYHVFAEVAHAATYFGKTNRGYNRDWLAAHQDAVPWLKRNNIGPLKAIVGGPALPLAK